MGERDEGAGRSSLARGMLKWLRSRPPAGLHACAAARTHRHTPLSPLPGRACRTCGQTPPCRVPRTCAAPSARTMRRCFSPPPQSRVGRGRGRDGVAGQAPGRPGSTNICMRRPQGRWRLPPDSGRWACLPPVCSEAPLLQRPLPNAWLKPSLLPLPPRHALQAWSCSSPASPAGTVGVTTCDGDVQSRGACGPHNLRSLDAQMPPLTVSNGGDPCRLFQDRYPLADFESQHNQPTSLSNPVKRAVHPTLPIRPGLVPLLPQPPLSPVPPVACAVLRASRF